MTENTASSTPNLPDLLDATNKITEAVDHAMSHMDRVRYLLKQRHADYCPVNCKGGCDDCLGQLGCTCGAHVEAASEPEDTA